MEVGAPAAGGGHGLVWVNTETHVYHKEGSRFYGKTKKAKYGSELRQSKKGTGQQLRGFSDLSPTFHEVVENGRR